jgi:hypothetical protein
VVEVRQEIHRAEQVPDGALLPMSKKLSQGLAYGVLLGSKATCLPRPVKQAIVDLKICGHPHTIRHTLNVSMTTPPARYLAGLS